MNTYATELANMVFDRKPLIELIVYLSRLFVVDKEFLNCLSYDLGMLSTDNKLKYYNKLSLAQNLLLVHQFLLRYGEEDKEYANSYFHLIKTPAKLLQPNSMTTFDKMSTKW